ncbi:MAG: hypothetical protein NW220_19655 [Leptolyngbyaceae cyanobacterium bins.349]|nr:hypothetical protein [Leptolyngbyaceae cyanobacterium bins.349]
MKIIEIQVDEQLFQQAQAIAESRQSIVQELLIELLHSLTESGTTEPTVATESPEYDPITPLIGTLHLGTHDLGEHHDYYIGQALLRELRQTDEDIR